MSDIAPGTPSWLREHNDRQRWRCCSSTDR